MDVAVAVVGLFGLGTLLEWRLRDLFARHEVRESKMHMEAQLTAEGASAAARVNSGHIDVLRTDLAEQRADVANISVLVRMHDARLGALSERLYAAALRVPTPQRDES